MRMAWYFKLLKKNWFHLKALMVSTVSAYNQDQEPPMPWTSQQETSVGTGVVFCSLFIFKI